MKRRLLLAIFPLLLAGLLCAQESPAPGLFSSDLVAWSGMQQPQAPEDRSGEEPHNAAPAPEKNQSQQAGDHATDAGKQAPSASTFTGTVSKEADDLVLKVSETATYKLDSKQKIEQYEGQRVRVTGTIEPGVNVIHVDSIEPLS